MLPDQVCRVLLIEDNPGDAVLIEEGLSGEGGSFDIIWTKSLGQACSIDRGAVDIVLTDLNLPDSSGRETFAKVLRHFPDKPVVVLTGLSDAGLGVDAVASGCQDYLVKNGDGDAIRRSIRYALERKAVETRLRQSEERFRSLFRVAANPMLLCLDGRIVMANSAAERLFGAQDDPLAGWSLADLMPDVSAGDLQRIIDIDRPDGQEASAGPLVIAAHGEQRHFDAVSVPLNFGDDRLVQVLLHDVTDHLLLEQEQKFASALFRGTAEAMMVTDEHNLILSVNDAFTEVTGYSMSEVVGRNPSILASGRHDAPFYKDMWVSIVTDGHWRGEVWNRKKDGQIYVQRLTISAIRDRGGRITNFVSVFSDVTQERQAADAVLERATHDALTGLPNRALFTDRLVQDLAKSKRRGVGVSVLFVDLDGFKLVNDTLGHLAGDLLLQGVAQRFLGCVRESDTVARLGGDEFVILLPDVGCTDTAQAVAAKLLAVLERPFAIEGREVRVGASIGVALSRPEGDSAQAMIEAADNAMYAAKKAGRGCVRVAERGSGR